MAKSFRLRLWCIFPSFRSCRSREATIAAVSPAYRLPPVGSDSSDVDLRQRRPRQISSRFYRQARWRGVMPPSPRRKIDSDDGGAMLSVAPRRRRAASRRREYMRVRGNDSSVGEDSGWFSSEEENESASKGFNQYYYYHRTGVSEHAEEDEREMLISSTDVDSYDDCVVKWAKRRSIEWEEEEAPVAVVQQSENPREDFRLSMAEMVVEKEIFDTVGLQQLLYCFLSLNSVDHHAAIVAAFEDIWTALFSAATAPDDGFSEMGLLLQENKELPVNLTDV